MDKTLRKWLKLQNDVPPNMPVAVLRPLYYNRMYVPNQASLLQGGSTEFIVLGSSWCSSQFRQRVTEIFHGNAQGAEATALTKAQS
jgi:hypothetical protein